MLGTTAAAALASDVRAGRCGGVLLASQHRDCDRTCEWRDWNVARKFDPAVPAAAGAVADEALTLRFRAGATGPALDASAVPIAVMRREIPVDVWNTASGW